MTQADRNGAKRVFVVDPHPVTLRGLAALVDRDRDLELAGGAATLRAALQEVAAAKVDLIVVEPLVTPNEEAALIATLSRVAPSARILVVSARTERGYVDLVLDTGVAGFVSKAEPQERVADAIRSVLAGDTVIAGVCSGR